MSHAGDLVALRSIDKCLEIYGRRFVSINPHAVESLPFLGEQDREGSQLEGLGFQCVAITPIVKLIGYLAGRADLAYQELAAADVGEFEHLVVRCKSCRADLFLRKFCN